MSLMLKNQYVYISRTFRCPAKVSENMYLLTEMQSVFENYIEQSDKTQKKFQIPMWTANKVVVP